MKKIFLLLVSLWLMIEPLVTQAEYTLGDSHSDYRPKNAPNNPYDYQPESISLLLGEYITVLLQIAGGVAIFFIVQAGLYYVIAMGQQEKIDEAKRSLTWGLIGLVIIILAYAIIQNILKIVFNVPSELF